MVFSSNLFLFGFLPVAELILKDRFKFQISGVPGNLYTMLAVMVGWVIFRCADFKSGLEFLQLLFGFQPKTTAFVYFPFRYYLPNDVILYLAAAGIFAWVPVERFENRRFWQSVSGVAVAGVTSLLLIVYSAIVLSTVGFNPFIYFRF